MMMWYIVDIGRGDGVVCSLRIEVVGNEVVASCSCGWLCRQVFRPGHECEQMRAPIAAHLTADGLLVLLAQLIGPRQGMTRIPLQPIGKSGRRDSRPRQPAASPPPPPCLF
jgi:hypothetical protein